ncbi:farnesol dehydrogenase-like [Planococcus citri]|uniref:farnesol dehydrogenase-like n=1 Tax=Planococcus citri TaxID=170843 RepID=UPI0031F90827
MERFFKKVAVITGAGSGIGAAVVKELLAYDICVVGLDLDEKKLQAQSNNLTQKKLKGRFLYKKCDVTRISEIKDVFHWIDTEVGSIAILVNSAGILIRKTLLDVSDEEITKTMDVNFKGLLLCCQEAMKIMIKNQVDGHLININSINGHHVRLRPEISLTMIYAASKYGVTAVTEGLRQEIAKRNLKIKCTSISPGHVITPLTDIKRDVPIKPTEVVEPKNIAEACISVLNTAPFVLISELTIMGIHQEI